MDFTVIFSEDVVNFDAAADVVITHTGTANTGVTITDGPQTYTVNVTAITGDGSFTLAASTASDIQDLAANALISSVTSAAVTIDNTAPVVGVDTLSTSDSSPELTGTVDDTTASVSVTVDGQTNPAVNNGNGTWTLADNTLTALADGLFDVSATATDAAGNAGTDVTVDELAVDTFIAAPQLPAAVPYALSMLAFLLALAGGWVTLRRRRVSE